MENRGYSIYEVGILGGNDKGEIKFILFLMFKFLNKKLLLTGATVKTSVSPRL